MNHKAETNYKFLVRKEVVRKYSATNVVCNNMLIKCVLKNMKLMPLIIAYHLKTQIIEK